MLRDRVYTIKCESCQVVLSLCDYLPDTIFTLDFNRFVILCRWIQIYMTILLSQCKYGMLQCYKTRQISSFYSDVRIKSYQGKATRLVCHM
jgi:hypothetical protein